MVVASYAKGITMYGADTSFLLPVDGHSHLERRYLHNSAPDVTPVDITHIQFITKTSKNPKINQPIKYSQFKPHDEVTSRGTLAGKGAALRKSPKVCTKLGEIRRCTRDEARMLTLTSRET